MKAEIANKRKAAENASASKPAPDEQDDEPKTKVQKGNLKSE
jgi:hypothetical protein